MSVESNKVMGKNFFMEQDRLHGGPAPQICAPSYAANIAGFPTFDLAGHEQFAKAFYTGFPDISHTVDETVADEDSVAVRFTLRGTHSGDFMGIPPTGRKIEVSAMAILRVADGKIRTLRGVFDQMSLMRQLGVLPQS